MPPKKSPKKSPKPASKSAKSPKSKSAAKSTASAPASSPSHSNNSSYSPSGKRKRPKKGPKEEKSKQILALRDELISQGKDAERVGQACMGMYRCDKQKDDKCLDGIMEKLNTIKTGGRAKSPKRR